MSLVSVIIPVFNAEKTLLKALHSVKSQQGNIDFEILIINDGSKDNSERIVQEFISQNPESFIHYIKQENKGVSAARNVGLKLAKGDFIALLDADDEWLPQKIERQLSCFIKYPEIDFLASRRNGKPLLWPYATSKELASVSFKKLLIRNEITSPSVIFKKKILEKTGYYDENQRYAEDVYFYMKVSEFYKMYILNESLVITGSGKRTFGSSGLSANLREMKKGFQSNLRKVYLQKRITTAEFYLYSLFYRFKYWLLLFRTMMTRG